MYGQDVMMQARDVADYINTFFTNPDEAYQEKVKLYGEDHDTDLDVFSEVFKKTDQNGRELVSIVYNNDPLFTIIIMVKKQDSYKYEIVDTVTYHLDETHREPDYIIRLVNGVYGRLTEPIIYRCRG